MSVEELQARIEKLSVDIVRQKEVLGDLERMKSATQRQLNDIRDPMARLPLEISSEIFVQCLPEAHQPVNASESPSLFLNVCNTWSDIAVATPRLWNSIHIGGCHSNPASLLDAWTQRAGSLALSISLPHRLTHGTSAVIKRNAHRVYDLRMSHDDEDIAFITDAGPLTALRTLTMSGIEMDRFRCSSTATMNILRACPNLVECTFRDVFPTEIDEEDEILVLPRLRIINFGTSPDRSNDYVLQHLALPALRSLYISFYDMLPKDFLQFLIRSSPPLQQLILGDTGGEHDTMTECFSLLPSLTHIEFVHPGRYLVDQFLATLAGSPRLLPNLSAATLHFDPPYPEWYEGLFGALSARREHLLSMVVRGHESLIPEDVAGKLRQLVAGGMSIHIGPDELNYLIDS